MASARQLSKVLRTKGGFRQWIAALMPLPCDGERVTAQHDQRDQPPDCGVAVDVGAHKLAPSGSARPSALDLMRKWAADAAALKADRAAPQLRFPCRHSPGTEAIKGKLPSSRMEHYCECDPIGDPALLVAVQSDQKSGVPTGIGYS
jgi:hypothetical protein